MSAYTNALSLIEQLGLSGECAWVGDTPPEGRSFTACDLHRLPGFRPATAHFGRYASVWVVQDALAIQGWRILLDSCVRMLAQEGVLVLRYLQNQHLSVHALKNFLFRKYGLRVKVLAETVTNGEFVTAFRIERDASTLPKEKTWTFGLLTQGKKVDLVERFCRSVREYGGPSHEILIVGPRHAVYEPYQPTYIDKQYSTVFADICVKKNDIIERAQHENICLLHDRYILNRDFFTGFDEYGYDFDYLTIRQHHASGKIYPSYCATDDGGDLLWGPIYECGSENETWKRHYLNGGLIVAKRSLLRAVPFNDLLFHNQAEDVEVAKVLESRSVLPRINRISSAVTDVPDHLTDAFAFAAHPWESMPAADIRPEPPAAAPAVAAAPLLMADLNGVPWRRLKAVTWRVRNLRREGMGWADVGRTAARFVRRRLAGRAAAAAPHGAVAGIQPAASGKPRPQDREGCNILLYVGDTGGVLNVTVHYMRRLKREGTPFCIVAIDRDAKRSFLPDDLAPHVVAEPVYPHNVWCIGFPFVGQHLKTFSAWTDKRWNTNFTHWELPYVPQRLAGSFEGLDSLMTTSGFVRDALAGVTNLPIEIVDPDVRVASATVTRFGRDYFGLPSDKKLFLLNWEFTSSTIRKNPDAAMRAFEEAFAGMEDRVALVMHVKIASGKDETAHEAYVRFLDEVRTRHPRVIVVERESLTYEEALGLKHACDCFVSLHRSEGYGMGCAEALALGRYCIMTGWSGNMELLKKAEWRPRIATVAVALVPVTPADFLWVEEQDDVFQLWADVRHGDAVRKMRDVFALMNEKEGALTDVA